MTILTPEQLTGRVGTHVLELSHPSCMLHPSAAAAFRALARAAARDGIELAAASSFRSFERQLTIWNDKFAGRRPLLDRDGRALQAAALDEEGVVRAILQWSALPGASRHHWGSEIDVFDRAALGDVRSPQLVPGEYVSGGVFERLGAFLAHHAGDYEFFLPYDRDRGGVQPEPWHLSYAPLAVEALPALTLPVLAEALQTAPLAGAATVARLLPEIHARYVLAVGRPSLPTKPS